MRIDLESRSVQGLSTFLTFVVLNVLYLLACLPVLTIGVATSALYEVCLRYADEERGHLIRDFFAALRRNLGRATAVYLILGLPVLLLAFAARFWFALGGVLSVGATILAGAGALYLFASLLHGLALVAAYRGGVRQTVRNALLLPGAEPLRSAGLVLIPVTCLALVVITPAFLYVVGTIGFSVGAYGSAHLLRSVFRRYPQVDVDGPPATG